MREIERLVGRMSIERQSRGDSFGNLVVGSAFLRCLSEEWEVEGSRLRAGQVPKGDLDLLASAIEKMEYNWSNYSGQSVADIAENANRVISERLEDILTKIKKESPSVLSRAIFEIWTGVAANFAWIIVTGILAFCVLLAFNDWSPPRALQIMFSVGKNGG